MNRAGELRHVVQIQSLSAESVNTHGERIQTWTNTSTRRAKIEFLGGSEGDGTEQTQAFGSALITMRYHSTLDERTHRFTWQGRTWGIELITHDAKKTMTEVRVSQEITPYG